MPKPLDKNLEFHQTPNARALGAMLACERWYADAAKEIVSVIFQAGGNAVWAARELNVQWRTLRRWCADYPELQRALDAARGRLRDEKQALRAVQATSGRMAG